jgi:hypothetical protein
MKEGGTQQGVGLEGVLFTGAALYALSSVLLISNKF